MRDSVRLYHRRSSSYCPSIDFMAAAARLADAAPSSHSHELAHSLDATLTIVRPFRSFWALFGNYPAILTTPTYPSMSLLIRHHPCRSSSSSCPGIGFVHWPPHLPSIMLPFTMMVSSLLIGCAILITHFRSTVTFINCWLMMHR